MSKIRQNITYACRGKDGNKRQLMHVKIFTCIRKGSRGKRRRAAVLLRRQRSVTVSKSGSVKRSGYSSCVAALRIKYVVTELDPLYFCFVSGLWHAASAAVSSGFRIISTAAYKCPFLTPGSRHAPAPASGIIRYCINRVINGSA